MKSKFRKHHRREHQEEAELQITSLADILIIVLVFLLKSYSAGLEAVADVSLPEGLNLPVSQVGGQDKDGLRIEILQSGIQVQGEPAAGLEAFRFPEADLNSDLTDNGTSINLTKYLTERRSHYPEGTKVWIVGDRRAPYATIQTVLASASISGFQDFRLAVVKDE